MISRATIAALAVFLLSISFASGYIVGTVKSTPQSPVESGLPDCTRWGFLQPTPHNPETALKCKLITGITDAEMRRRMRRNDI